MNNFELWKLLNFIIGKDINSNSISGPEFDSELKSANIQLLRKKLGFPESYQPGTATSGVDATRLLQTDISPFYEEAANAVALNGIFVFNNWFYLEDFYVAGSRRSEISSRQELSNRISDPQLKPTTKDAVAYLVSEGLKVLPASIVGITVWWIRQPNEPVFAIKTGANNEPEYDTANSVELEWDDAGKIDILHLILSDIGVNTERQDIVAHADKIIKTGK